MSIPASKINVPVLSMNNGRFILRCHFIEREVAGGIAGAKWSPASRAWEYPAHPHVYREIMECFPRIYVDPDAEVAIKEMLDAEETVSELKAAGWEKAIMIEPMPLKTTPFNHQILAFNLACKVLGVFHSASEK